MGIPVVVHTLREMRQMRFVVNEKLHDPWVHASLRHQFAYRLNNGFMRLEYMLLIGGLAGYRLDFVQPSARLQVAHADDVIAEIQARADELRKGLHPLHVVRSLARVKVRARRFGLRQRLVALPYGSRCDGGEDWILSAHLQFPGQREMHCFIKRKHRRVPRHRCLFCRQVREDEHDDRRVWQAGKLDIKFRKRSSRVTVKPIEA